MIEAMQQTDKYKLNKPGVDDPIAIAPLNENMDKLEAALAAETAVRQGETAGLNQRVTVLDAHKVRIATGSFAGNATKAGDFQVIQVGFTPKFVFLRKMEGTTHYLFTPSAPITFYEVDVLKVVEGGFQITREAHSSINDAGDLYCYIAFI